MSGTARAHFSCGAISSYSPHADALCNNNVTVDLVNDGQYDSFDRPEGWHIELGTTIARTVVRCPSHCEWTEYKEFRTSQWVDAP